MQLSRKKNLPNLFTPKSLQLLTLIIVLAIFPLLYGAPGTGDVPGFIVWGNNIRDFGVLDGYALDQGPYPPFILHLFAIAFANPFVNELSVLKILSLVLLALVFIFYRAVFNLRMSLLVLLILYVPTLGLGYVDIYFIVPLAACLELLRRNKIVLASQFFLITVMCKFTPLICGPFFVFFGLTRLFGSALRKFTLAAGLISAEIVLISYVYGFQTLFENLKLGLMNAYASGNALNVGWLITWFFPNLSAVPQSKFAGLEIQRIYLDVHGLLYVSMRICFYLVLAFIAYTYLRSPRKFCNLVVSITATILAYITFSPGVHENHILLIVPFLIYLVDYKMLGWLNVWGLVLFTNFNMLVFYGLTGNENLRAILGFADLSGYFAIIQTLYFCYLIIIMTRINLRRLEFRSSCLKEE